jgi:hypothetical protein
MEYWNDGIHAYGCHEMMRKYEILGKDGVLERWNPSLP